MSITFLTNKDQVVKSVNGIAPDENGNVQVEAGGSSGGNLYTFRNLLDLNDENYEPGTYIYGGQTYANAGYATSGYIEVFGGDKICLTVNANDGYKQIRKPEVFPWFTYFDENKAVVQDDGRHAGERIYHYIPDNVRYIRVSVYADMISHAMIEKLTCVGISDEYLEYGEEKIVPGPAVDNQDGIFLPPYIYAVKGRPFDIYNVAMFGDTQNLNRIERIGYDWSSFGTMQMSNRRVRITPTGGDSNSLYLKVKNAEGVTILSTATQCVVKTGSTSAKRIATIGDSLSNDKPWMAELMRLNPSYNFVGSVSGGAQDSTGTARSFKHDARSGWTAEMYYTGGGHALCDSANNGFSFSYFVTNTLGGTAPDIVILFLGMNDMAANVDSAINYEKLIVDNIRSSYPSLPIVICAPQARDYDKEGHVAKNGFIMMKKLYETFSLYQNLYFVPLYLIHDSEYNYRLANEQEGVNLYSTFTENKVTDSVHPQNAGYFQFADAIYGALSAIG